MKILQVHNYYQYSGGEDAVIQNEKKLLEQHGHEVKQYTRHNDEIKGIRQKVSLLLSTHYSNSSKKDFLKKLIAYTPDVVHTHNFFPLITPSIFDTCQEMDIPVVMTLHNYRLIYPNGYLFHDGKVDERPILGSAYTTVLDGVYRNSKLQTAVVAHMIEYHRKKNTWNSKIKCLIALTDFSKRVFIKSGILSEKIRVKPNFTADQYTEVVDDKPYPDPYFVFVGRISEEKGIEMLVKTWVNYQLAMPLFILGNGPLLDPLKTFSKHSKYVHWLGHQPQSQVLQYVKHAQALVFPSIWYEGFPMTIVEAFSLGTPVITSNIGSQAEIVKDQYNGVHFQLKNKEDLALKITELSKDTNLAKQLGASARSTYLNKYTPEKNYQELISIYNDVVLDNQ